MFNIRHLNFASLQLIVKSTISVKQAFPVKWPTYFFESTHAEKSNHVDLHFPSWMMVKEYVHSHKCTNYLTWRYFSALTTCNYRVEELKLWERLISFPCSSIFSVVRCISLTLRRHLTRVHRSLSTSSQNCPTHCFHLYLLFQNYISRKVECDTID